jgi:hypothetical protein
MPPFLILMPATCGEFVLKKTPTGFAPIARGRVVRATFVRVPHPSWLCLDGDFGFMSQCGVGEWVNPGSVLAEFVSVVRESYRTTPSKHKKLVWDTQES